MYIVKIDEFRRIKKLPSFERHLDRIFSISARYFYLTRALIIDLQTQATT